MAEYIARLWKDHSKRNTAGAQVKVDAVTEFEAAALALKQLRLAGEEFSGDSGLELLQGNVTASTPVAVRDIMHWLRDKADGQALVQRDDLQLLLDYVKK